MSNLDQTITEWRRQMLAAGIKTPVPLEELEIHLREEIERQMKSGLSEAEAFEAAVQQIGQGQMLQNEFKKVSACHWNRPLAMMAWVVFVVSFFLPATRGLRGWQCAGWILPWNLGALSKPGDGRWVFVHYELLNLANLLMVASPFLLRFFGQEARSMRWLRHSAFAALALTGLMVLEEFFLSVGKLGLAVGYYLWVFSFALLYVSTVLEFRSMARKQYV
jgi:hypothetical protein